MNGRTDYDRPSVKVRRTVLALAVLATMSASPVAAQQTAPAEGGGGEVPSQVRELIDLLDDPAVRAWIEQRRSTAPPPQAAVSDPEFAPHVIETLKMQGVEYAW
jgi:hypothetical protein